MRILHCIWSMNAGGAERQLVQLTQAMSCRGAKIHVAVANDGFLDAAVRASGATLHRLGKFGDYDPSLALRIAHLIRRVKPNVVNTWLVKMDIAGGAAARLMRVPWVLSERSSTGAYFPSPLHALRKTMGVHARAIIANSQGGRDYWRRFRSADAISVIPNIVAGADIDAATPIAGAVPADADLIVSACGLREEKNLHRLVDAIALVMRSRSVFAAFCGDGPLRASLEAHVQSLGIADRIIFTGVTSDVWRWMKRASAVVAVSHWEGEPNSVLEAIACGAPLVVSDIPAHRALVSENAATIVDLMSVESIAGGLCAALTDREGARVRAASARTALSGRNADRIAAAYEDVYRGVIAR